MSGYALLVFLHVLGAVAMFAAWSIEMVAVQRLRRASSLKVALTWLALCRLPARFGRLGMLTAAVTGVWMMATRWGPLPWMVAAIAGLAALLLIAVVLDRRAARALDTTLAGQPDRLPAGLGRAGALLAASLRARVAIGVAILAMMTIKPGTTGSLLLLGAALAAGLLPATARARHRAAG